MQADSTSASRFEVEPLVQRAGGSTVGNLFASTVERYPRRPAVSDGPRTWSYEELAGRANRAANALLAHGIRAGDRVAVLSENSLEYVVLILAAARIGCILACQNWHLTPTELEHCLALVEPRLVLTSERFAPRLDTVRETGTPRAVIERELEDWMGAAPTGEPPATVCPEDPLLILYTSGTTGLPKGAIISHRAEIARHLVHRADLGLEGSDTFVCWSPLYHMGGADHTISCLLAGAKVVVMDGFDADALVEVALHEAIWWLHVMPGTTRQVIAALRRSGRRPVGVKICGVMADLIPRHELAELTQLLDAPFVNTFGATETGAPPASADLLPVGELPETLSKRQSAYCQIRLVDEADRDVAPGQPGELAMRGPTLFSGYWGNPEATRKDFRGGWFHMGDVLVRNPDGSLDFVDRAKYLIKSGGENIYPAEIEQVLLRHPQVIDAAVVRYPDPRWGEVPIAFVSRRDPSLGEPEIRALCRERLAGYKQPKAIRFIEFEDFPRSASGKIQRHELERRLVDSSPNPPDDSSAG